LPNVMKIGMTLAALLVLAVLIALCSGSTQWLSPIQLFQILKHGPPADSADPIAYIVWQLRLPRVLLAMFVGCALSASGTAFQALFRNPLADPYVIGVSSSAAVGGAAAILLPPTVYSGMVQMGMAFTTAMAGLALVIAVGSPRANLQLSSIVLAGVALGSFLWAFVAFVLMMSGQDSTRILFWLLGSFVGADWQKAAMMGSATTLGLIVLIKIARPLTIFSIGETSAAHLGVETVGLKWITLIFASLLAAASVSIVGVIGFVGLFVPHICRKIVRPDLRTLLPVSAAAGGAFMVLADAAAQRLGEINTGIVTAMIGAPVLFVLMRAKDS